MRYPDGDPRNNPPENLYGDETVEVYDVTITPAVRGAATLTLDVEGAAVVFDRNDPKFSTHRMELKRYVADELRNVRGFDVVKVEAPAPPSGNAPEKTAKKKPAAETEPPTA